LGLDDFDGYVDEPGIHEEDYPAAFALWIAEITGGPVPRFEKVEREEPADGVVIEGDDPLGSERVALETRCRGMTPGSRCTPSSPLFGWAGSSEEGISGT
jgi:hypothetical protein